MNGFEASGVLFAIGLFYGFVFALCTESKFKHGKPTWAKWVHYGGMAFCCAPLLLRLFLIALMD